MPPVLDRTFELLFKYRPAVFREGRLVLDAPRPLVVALVCAAVALGAVVVATYLRVGRAAGATGTARGGRHAGLMALRVAALALVAACLLRPTLVLATAVPRRNTVAVLVDDSRSMRVPDWTLGGRSAARGDFAATALAPEAPLLQALAREYAVRTYRFSRTAERVAGVAGLTFAGDRTHIGTALERARAELSGVPLAGLVVVSDGADGDPAALAEATRTLRAGGTPVFTVGVGREASARDLELSRVETPAAVLRGTTMAVDATVAHAGMGGRTVAVVAEDGGRVVARQEVRLPAGDGATPVRLQVPAAEAGARRLTVRVVPQPGEALVENNQREALVRVDDRREKVLYFEGEPRFEFKFVRRAVAADENLRLVALQRTAENKYLRLGVADSLDLVSGFPTTREELFSYRAVVLGSVAASAFTAEQLRMLADFVGERGGGLLLLGGRHALAEGGYAGTALADVMPVVLEAQAGPADRDPAPRSGQAEPVVELAVRPTPAGAALPALQLAPDARASAERWRTLPPLTAVNLVRRVKPGATVLLAGAAPGGAGATPNATGARVVLAHQRFGRGRAVAFAVQDSWLWQMHASVDTADLSHELFWRQMLRWLVSGAPGPVTVAASAERPAPGEPVALRAEVRDSAFAPVNGARVVARVTAPSGARTEVPMEWGVERDGEYRAAFTPAERGVHEVVVEARDGARDLGAAEPAYLDAAEPRDEYFGSGMRAGLLRRLAAETGGRFYTPETVGALPEDLRYARGGVTAVERKELWDMPVVFLALGGLLTAEWFARRARGLA
jgi:uncharacterized membrane protein